MLTCMLYWTLWHGSVGLFVSQGFVVLGNTWNNHCETTPRLSHYISAVWFTKIYNISIIIPGKELRAFENVLMKIISKQIEIIYGVQLAIFNANHRCVLFEELQIVKSRQLHETNLGFNGWSDDTWWWQWHLLTSGFVWFHQLVVKWREIQHSENSNHHHTLRGERKII